MSVLGGEVTGGSVEPAEAVVSVVVACRNAERYLTRQMSALAGQVYPGSWELVIADNGSTDRSLAIVEEFRGRFPHLVVVDCSEEIGPGAARNAGVRAARGERIVFCDADDEVAPGWLAAMAEALREHDFVAGQLDHDLLNESWALPLRRPRSGLLDTNPPFLPYAYGAALGVQRSVHDLIGGFDATFGAEGEDRDYCYRAQLAGFPLIYVPQAVIHYRHRDTVLGTYRQARGYARGAVRLYRDYRHLGLRRMPVYKPLGSWALAVLDFLPALTARRRFARWMSRLGWRVGGLEGSIRYRVWAL